jgi:geranylgeranyl reductase family protein
MSARAIDAQVLVVGGGPAGAVAARTLAAAGLDTLIVDRAAFPRNKPCGGGLTTRVQVRFPWLDSAIDAVDRHEVSRLHLEGPDDAVLTLDAPRPCVLLVRRVAFDHALVNAAVAAGARLESGFDVMQASLDDAGYVEIRSRDGRRRTAPLAIATDGVHSVVAKRLGVNVRWPRSRLAIDMMEETPTERLRATAPDVLWVAYAHARMDGYAYVFPKARHVNVGVGCVLSHFDRAVDERPYTLQSRLVESLVGRGVLAGTSDPGQFTPFLIPVGGPLERTWYGPVLFAGDAGGFVNALTAEGIYYAMVSGELAARAMIETQRAGSRAAGPAYERLWRGEIGAELDDAVTLQRFLFSTHARVARVIRGASRVPWLTTAILEYVRGEHAYSRLRRHVLFRFPMMALKLARERWSVRAEAAAS